MVTISRGVNVDAEDSTHDSLLLEPPLTLPFLLLVILTAKSNDYHPSHKIGGELLLGSTPEHPFQPRYHTSLAYHKPAVVKYHCLNPKLKLIGDRSIIDISWPYVHGRDKRPHATCRLFEYALSSWSGRT
ncbi:unnamed protein product [Tuber melanosporum]|uniref:(Perigord truffle) hypothetical protein n=1 Tax=Tuber melanosporum (strain Mel28) TaxID=656061 RepID=D5G659_TUBMM|nr:uncharacterized protein GSTUM_00001783001 [Tuber melanosporum]CAZ80002.1 unnamed protein product [Tuber melanosporum]